MWVIDRYVCNGMGMIKVKSYIMKRIKFRMGKNGNRVFIDLFILALKLIDERFVFYQQNATFDWHSCALIPH